MELQGKIIQALEPRSGVSARGEWKAQDFVIETHESYPHKMVFSVFGADRLQRFNIQVGQEVLVSFDIDAHEYQGRWFNSIRAFDVRLVDARCFCCFCYPRGSRTGWWTSSLPTFFHRRGERRRPAFLTTDSHIQNPFIPKGFFFE